MGIFAVLTDGFEPRLVARYTKFHIKQIKAIRSA